MKKKFLRGILLIMCFMLVGCGSTKKEEEAPDIPSLDEREKLDAETINELNKVKVIKIYRPDYGTDEVKKWKIVKEVTDSVDIDSIISIISDGRKIENDEAIYSVGSSFKLGMYKEDGSLIYDIYIYTAPEFSYIELKTESDYENDNYSFQDNFYIIEPIHDVLDAIVNK